MWVCLVQMRARQGKETDLVSMCEEWLKGAEEKGCVEAEILFDPDDASLVILLERT